jgi:serine/threonine-protein kinase
MFDALEAHTPPGGAPPVTIVPGRAAHASRTRPADARGPVWPTPDPATAGTEPPPSFDPRTGRRTQPASAPTHRAPGARAGHPTTRAHARVTSPARRVRWPLLVLGVLLLALLGAAFAGRLTGAADAPTAPDGPGYARADASDGMIFQHVPAPTARDTGTTTAKDA